MSDTPSRRYLLKAATGLLVANAPLAAVAQAAAEPPQSHAGAGRPSPIQLGMASYTFRNFDRSRMLTSMKQLGLTNLNVKDFHLPMGAPDAVRAGAAELRAAGMRLTAVGTVTFAKDDEADIRSKFDYARAAGVPVIVAAPTRAVLPRLEPFVRQYDIRIAIHNHGPEDKEFPSPLDAFHAVEHMDRRLGCCIDVGHSLRAGTDPVEAIRTIGPRVFDIHMKDLANPHDRESQVAVGRGIMPIRGIFDALIATGYGGFVDLEYEIHPDDPMPGVIESIAYERGVLSGMGYSNAPATSNNLR